MDKRDERDTGGLEFSQRSIRFSLVGLVEQQVQLAIAGILLNLRVPLLPIPFAEPVAQLSIFGFGQLRDGLLYFGYGFHIALGLLGYIMRATYCP